MEIKFSILQMKKTNEPERKKPVVLAIVINMNLKMKSYNLQIEIIN